MATSVYIASIQPRAGKSLAALGLMELASRRVERLGFFRPVVNGAAEADREIGLMRARYALRQSAEASSGGPYDEARAMAGADQSDELLARILMRYKALETECDFVVCEGTDYTGVGAAFEFEFNARVAAHLGCPVFFVANGQGREPAEIVEDVRGARRAFEREGCSIVATLVNRVAPEQIDEVKESFAGEWNGRHPVYVVPEDETLGHPTLAEVMDALDGKLLFGDQQRLQGLARGFAVAAMELPSVLTRLRPGAVVITGGDRADVVLACLGLGAVRGIPQHRRHPSDRRPRATRTGGSAHRRLEANGGSRHRGGRRHVRHRHRAQRAGGGHQGGRRAQDRDGAGPLRGTRGAIRRSASASR